MKGVIALVGLSGAGKSTLLRLLAKRLYFDHLVASDLIKAELARLNRGVASSDELRLGTVVDNQQLLVDGFLRKAAAAKGPIVFDGHVLIDGKNGLVPISAQVFRKIGINHLVFLQEIPSTICLRRIQDHTRSRPRRTEEEIGEQQAFAIKIAAGICLELSIDMLVITSSVPKMLEHLLLAS